jgi:hypothetical protein
VIQGFKDPMLDVAVDIAVNVADSLKSRCERLRRLGREERTSRQL